MITKEKLQDRLEVLRADEQRAFAQLTATQGAIQDCEYWVKVLSEENDDTPAKA